MAPGLQVTLALATGRGLPQAINDIVTSMDNEMNSLRDELSLPVEMTRWAVILSSRATCNVEAFSTTAVNKVAHRRALLLELYPGDGDLLARFDVVVKAASKTFSVHAHSWQQYKMLYDIYLLRLEANDRSVTEQAFTKLDCIMQDLIARVAELKAQRVRWEPSFRLTLTETGWQKCMELLAGRKAWTTGTFANKVTEVVGNLQQVTEERGRLVNSTNALWDEHFNAWFSHDGNRVPTEEFCTAIRQYLESMSNLSVHDRRQKDLIAELKSQLRRSEGMTTTLGSVDEICIPYTDIRESFAQYEKQTAQAKHIVELSTRFAEELLAPFAILSQARQHL